MIYKTEMDETARRDAEIKAEFEKVKALTPNKKEYQQELKEHVEAFYKAYPIAKSYKSHKIHSKTQIGAGYLQYHFGE